MALAISMRAGGGKENILDVFADEMKLIKITKVGLKLSAVTADHCPAPS